MIECNCSGGIDISSLSSSHKRVGCDPPTFSTAPEPKRSLLLFNNTDKEVELPLSPLKITDDSLLSFETDSDKEELMFRCENDHVFDNQNNNIIKPTIEEKVISAATTVSDDEIEFNNIANSSDYIRSLLNIVNSSASEQIFSPSIDEVKSNSDKNELVKGSLFPSMLCTGLNNSSTIIQENTNSISDDNLDTSISNSDRYIEEEEDFLLRNLPTSFDDFQTKEFNLKLERNYSTPRSSRRQSPIGMFTNDLISLPSTIQSKQSSQLSLASKNSSINSLVGSRTQSLSSSASHNNFEDLDDNDLEVAMINESFEEQLKQSLIYEQLDLKSLFYGVFSSLDNQKNKSNYLTNKLPDTILEASHEFENIEDVDDDEISYLGSITPPINLSGNEFIPLLTPKSRQFIMQRRQQFCRSSKYEIPTSNFFNKSTGDLGISDDNVEAVLSLRHRSERGYFSEEDTSSTFSAPISGNQDLDSRTEISYYNENFGELENLYNEKIKHRLDVRLKKMMLNNYEGEDETFSPDLHSENMDSSNKEQDISFVSNSSFCTAENEESLLHLSQEIFLEEIAAKAISDDDYYDSSTILNDFDNDKNPKLVPQLPEVLMGLGPSTSKKNFFTIAPAGAITPDICHFYISSKTVENDISQCESENSSATNIAKTVAYELFASLFESSNKDNSNSDFSINQSNNLNENNVASLNNTSVILETVNNTNNCCNFNNEDEMVYVSVQQDDEENSFELSPSSLLDLQNDENEDEESWRGPVDPEEFKDVQYSFYKQKTDSTTPSETDSSPPLEDEPKETVISNKDEPVEFVLSNNDSFEQQVPIFDSWEDMDDESVTKMADQAKLTLNQIKNEENALVLKNNQPSTSNCFESLSHVIEASYVGKTRSDSEISDAYRFLNINDDIWHKKVDDNHFLLIFSSSDKASQSLIAKNNSFLKFKSLKEASSQCRKAAELFKSQLIPKKKRGVTTVSVARRMIANSLNIKIDVSPEQKKKEDTKIADVKKQKRQKEEIWDN